MNDRCPEPEAKPGSARRWWMIEGVPSITALVIVTFLSLTATVLVGCGPEVETESGRAEVVAAPGPSMVRRGTDRPISTGPGETAVASGGIGYTNVRVRNVPWSIHVVAMDRDVPGLEVRSAHAMGAAVGLSPLSRHVAFAARPSGVALAAVNGDFYQRDRTFAGDPRGLQIVHGEVISAPTGGVAFWVQTNGAPATGPVQSRFEARWPNGRRTEFGLNCERRSGSIVLYTPSVGPATRTSGGRDLVLEPADGQPWGVLGMGRTYAAKVREVRENGNAPLAAGTLVLSVGPGALRNVADVGVGSLVTVETASEPDLAGVRYAIGGGPVLVRGGQRQKIVATGDGYSSSSMFERHPRSAVAWNDRQVFLVQVDGRQRGLSVGMTLEELATWLVKNGCREAMNLDGGGSATLWYDGQIRNSPCDGHERAIANSLVIVRDADASRSGASAAATAGGVGPAAAVSGLNAE